jgi:hypothetical protein
LEYQLASQMIKARAHASLIQDAVAERMGTTKIAVSWLESACKEHEPLVAILQRYAKTKRHLL